jgi:hypothetical protein
MKSSFQTNDLCLYYPLTIPSLRHSSLHNIRYGIRVRKGNRCLRLPIQLPSSGSAIRWLLPTPSQERGSVQKRCLVWLPIPWMPMLVVSTTFSASARKRKIRRRWRREQILLATWSICVGVLAIRRTSVLPISLHQLVNVKLVVNDRWCLASRPCHGSQAMSKGEPFWLWSNRLRYGHAEWPPWLTMSIKDEQSQTEGGNWHVSDATRDASRPSLGQRWAFPGLKLSVKFLACPPSRNHA